MEPYLGQIQLFAFGFAPDGWLLCNGALLQINENVALYSLLGTKFGGDGQTNFAIPNLVGARPQNVTSNYMCYYIASEGYYPPRS